MSTRAQNWSNRAQSCWSRAAPDFLARPSLPPLCPSSPFPCERAARSFPPLGGSGHVGGLASRPQPWVVCQRERDTHTHGAEPEFDRAQAAGVYVGVCMRARAAFTDRRRLVDDRRPKTGYPSDDDRRPTHDRAATDRGPSDDHRSNSGRKALGKRRRVFHPGSTRGGGGRDNVPEARQGCRPKLVSQRHAAEPNSEVRSILVLSPSPPEHSCLDAAEPRRAQLRDLSCRLLRCMAFPYMTDVACAQRTAMTHDRRRSTTSDRRKTDDQPTPFEA